MFKNRLKGSKKLSKKKVKIIFKADKTNNLYTIDTDNYKKFIFESVSSKQKIITNKIVTNIIA